MDDKTLSRRRRAEGLGLFLLLFSFYMLTTSRERPWADGTTIWQLAEAIVQRGEVSIQTRWPPSLELGKDGKVYALAPLLQGLMQVPAAALQTAIARHWPQAAELSWRLLCHLAPSALTALCLLLFFRLQHRLGISRPAAALTTGAAAVASTLWVYARYPYSEALQAACFMGFFAQVLAVREAPTRNAALMLGLWAGLLANSKIIYVACFPGAALYLAWSLRQRRPELLRLLAWASAVLVPLLLVIALYNHARWGSFLNAGYDTKGAATQERIVVGLWGFFFSPGKSLFLYSPPLVLSLLALPRLQRRWPHVLWAALAVAGPVVLLNASLLYWAGDYAWGPRYLVPLLPVLLLPAGLLIEDLLGAGGRWRRALSRAALVGVFAWGTFVQILGNAFHWDHFTRLQRAARNQWLGLPNTSGTAFPDFSGVCGACFEDVHGLQWLPPFQPIEGHWWLLKHVARGHDWVTAERDAPWRRYTALQLNIAATYEVARLDWWFLDYGGRNRPAGLLLMGIMLLGCTGGGFLFARAGRREIPAPAKS
jgi:hypothetical protein